MGDPPRIGDEMGAPSVSLERAHSYVTLARLHVAGMAEQRQGYEGFGASKTSDGVVQDVRYQYIHYLCYVPRCVCYVTHIQKSLLSDCSPSATLNRS